jgi:2-dehydro-3-deoxyphosphooctonate aldolase (KDO 8-P synthase)
MQIMNLNDLKSSQFFLIAGPCIVESQELCEEVAETLVNISRELGITYIFKASYRKANRSRIDSFSGLGDRKALEIIGSIKEKYNIPVLTDIHSAPEAEIAAEYVDIIQIPAFLCRQTDLLIAAAKTGRIINIKKGQFLAPLSMKYAAQKVIDSGNSNIILTERGSMFGYGDLVVDFRGIPEMKSLGFPVVLDITHSLQQPNQEKGVSGGRPELIETIARAGIAAGADGIFMETHPEPGKALSDGANMLQLDKAEQLLKNLSAIRQVINKISK